MSIEQQTINRLRAAIRIERLLETAVSLVEVPSPTRSAAAVADRLELLLERDGFEVDRIDAGWPQAPAVIAKYDSGRPGRTLQFNGHLDTVHLPFVPPRIEHGTLYGSGASDMKGGIAAMIEAARALRDAGALEAGSILLSAHELHESPWGDGSQVDGLIEAGCVGDAVLIPEYLADRVSVIGRGLAVMEVVVRREGSPVHEVLGGIDTPSVIAAGAELVRRFAELDRRLSHLTHPLAGRESLFVGQVHAGEIYNQSPTEFRLSGTPPLAARREHRDVSTGTPRDRDGGGPGKRHDNRSDPATGPRCVPIRSRPSGCGGVSIGMHAAVMGSPLPFLGKPFVDDGNTFASRAGIAAITHGPDAKGAHTLDEAVPVAELERVALVYALTAIGFCGG